MHQSEQWKPVPGWSDLYEVSNLGRARSLDRLVTQANNGGTFCTRPYRGRVLAATPNRKGYPAVSLSRDDVELRVELHRIIAAAFIGPCPEGMEVLHIDETRTNCRADNLRYGTHVENVRLGRSTALSSQDVRNIRAAQCKHGTKTKLARFYGVTQSNISAVICGKTWGDV